MDCKYFLNIFQSFIPTYTVTKVPIFEKPIISVHRGHVALYSLLEKKFKPQN